MVGAEGEDVLRVNHGEDVRVIGGILGGHVCCDRVAGVVNFYIYIMGVGILCCHFFHLALDFHLGVEDGQLNFLCSKCAAAAACKSHNHREGKEKCDCSFFHRVFLPFTNF